MAIFPRALPTSTSTISGSATLPVVGPFTIATSDYFIPNDSIANDMWIQGVVTDRETVKIFPVGLDSI